MASNNWDTHVILLIGENNQRKALVRDMLKTKFRLLEYSVNRHTKDVLAKIFMWDVALLDEDTEKAKIWRETPDPFWSKNLGKDFVPNKVLGKFGIGIMDLFSQNFWLSYIIGQIASNSQCNTALICDITTIGEMNYFIEKAPKLTLVFVVPQLKPLYQDDLARFLEQEKLNMATKTNTQDYKPSMAVVECFLDIWGLFRSGPSSEWEPVLAVLNRNYLNPFTSTCQKMVVLGHHGEDDGEFRKHLEIAFLE